MHRLALGLVLLVGCVHASPSTTTGRSLDSLRPEVQKLGEEARALLKEQDELIWQGWTTGTPIELEKLYDAHPKLFTADHVRAIREVRDATTEPLARRALSHLLTHFVGEYLSQQLADENERVARAEGVLNIDGKSFPLEDLDAVLANEPAQEKRRALYVRATPTFLKLAPAIKARTQRLSELLYGVGYKTPAEFAAELHEVDLSSLRALADETLNETDKSYFDQLEALSQRELGVSRTALTRADLPRLFRPKSIDVFFPKDTMRASIEGTFKAMGFDLTLFKTLRFEVDEAAKRNPRPLAITVEVPDDVRLSFRPAAGVAPLVAAFHETAHALQAVHTQALPFELSELGDGAVSDAYGQLFSWLLQDGEWLKEHAPTLKDREEAYRFAEEGRELHALREAAAAVLFAIDSAGKNEEEQQTIYSTLLTRVTGLSVTPEDMARMASDREDFIGAATSLRSALLAERLENHVTKKFGARWWATPQAGEFLKTLWSRGNSQTAEEVTQALEAMP